MTKRVLIVNCYFDETRRALQLSNKMPQAMGPAFLAGALSPELCEIRLYDEVSGGPLEDPDLLAWPDMLVLTGLTVAFDRMLHLTAYARTRNPRVIVVAGGPAVRALPRLSGEYFDYVCLGDVEELRDVAREAFGPAFVADQMIPRFDLASWITWLGYVESSRYCNFRCSFCALTGEGRGYTKYSLNDIRRQIEAMGRKKAMLFIDNNFYGNDRKYFLARVELAAEMRRGGHFKRWSALVTNDFFYNQENLEVVREAGCFGLFSGVESFDAEWLRSSNKLQNTRFPQVEMIRNTLEQGLAFFYGVIMDVTTRTVADLQRELEFITGNPEVSLPGFITLPIPLLGTPFFRDCLEREAFLPNTKLRDLDGTTVSLRPLDEPERVLQFVKDIQNLRGYRGRVLKHAAQFAARYRRSLSPLQIGLCVGSAALLCAGNTVTAPGWSNRRRRPVQPRTHLSTTEPLDAVYTPAFPVASRFERYFQPTMVTDGAGQLSEDLEELSVPVLVGAV